MYGCLGRWFVWEWEVKTNVRDDFLIIVMNKEVRLRSGVKLLSAGNLFSLLERFDTTTTDLTGDEIQRVQRFRRKNNV